MVSNYSKELVLSNIIGSNPTGIIILDNNPEINKNVNIIQNTEIASKQNLIKAQNNEIICNNIERFENKNKKLKEFFVFIFLILIIFLFLFLLKKKY